MVDVVVVGMVRVLVQHDVCSGIDNEWRSGRWEMTEKGVYEMELDYE